MTTPWYLGNIDRDIGNADWIKRGRWDLRASNVDELLAYLRQIRMTPAAFKTLPIYKSNVALMPWLKDLPDEIPEVPNG
jgi:hypothetical protein